MPKEWMLQSPGKIYSWYRTASTASSLTHLLLVHPSWDSATSLYKRQSVSSSGASQHEYAVADCRDTVQLYEQLYESGLQYGPAFRLLRNVHVPDAE